MDVTYSEVFRRRLNGVVRGEREFRVIHRILALRPSLFREVGRNRVRLGVRVCSGGRYSGRPGISDGASAKGVSSELRRCVGDESWIKLTHGHTCSHLDRYLVVLGV
jgi:hypothetical protein